MLPSRLLFGVKPKTARQPGERLPRHPDHPVGRRGSRTPGIGANAFDPEAVGALLAAKQRGADKPGSILVADLATAEALARTPA